MLDAMTAEDPDDGRTAEFDGERPTYVDQLDPDALDGARIGVLRRLGNDEASNVEHLFVGDNQTNQIFRAALDKMAAEGATIVENISLDDLDTRRAGFGFAEDFEQFLKIIDGPIQSYADACRTGKFSAHVYASTESCLNRANNLMRFSLGSESHQNAIRRYNSNKDLIERVMDELELDALVYPADGLGAPGVFSSRANCTVGSVSQTPALVVQAGSDNGLPVGLMFHGRKWDEAKLVALAYSYENATRHRQSPVLAAAADPVSVPAFDPQSATDLRLAVGEASFDEVLGTGGKFDLTSMRFLPIVTQVLEDNGYGWLVE
jgi:amidase